MIGCLSLPSCSGGGDHYGQASWIFYMRDQPRVATMSIREQGGVQRTVSIQTSSNTESNRVNFQLDQSELDELYRLIILPRFEFYEQDSQAQGSSVSFSVQDGTTLFFAQNNMEAFTVETQELLKFFRQLGNRPTEDRETP